MAAKSLVAEATHHKKRKRGIPVAIISLIVLFVLVIAVLYFTLFQKPERSVSDAVKSVLTSKSVKFNTMTMSETNGTKTSTNASGSMKDGQIVGTATLDFSKKSGKSSTPVQFAGDKSGKSYIKIDNAPQKLDDFLSVLASGNPAQGGAANTSKTIKDTYGPVAQDINGKWVTFAAPQQSQASNLLGTGGNTSQSCSNMLMLIQTNPADGQTIWKSYQEHPFINVTSTTNADISSLGYKLNFDKKVAAEFEKSIKSLKAGEAFVKCLNIAQSSTSGTEYEIWVDRVSHSLKKVIIHEPQSGGAANHTELSLSLGQSDQITIPTDAVNIQEVLKRHNLAATDK